MIKPILFSAPMVRALLAGTKTQTRRAVKGADQCHPDTRRIGVLDIGDDGCAAMPYDEFNRMLGGAIKCPYGKAGWQLWVRESIQLHPRSGPDPGTGPAVSVYVADGAWTVADAWPWKRKVLPSIHCPRGLSRITLDITGVRVERLHSISHDDACAEGIANTRGGATACIQRYRDVWCEINGLASWESNPWVWVVTFKRAIDRG